MVSERFAVSFMSDCFFDYCVVNSTIVYGVMKFAGFSIKHSARNWLESFIKAVFFNGQIKQLGMSNLAYTIQPCIGDNNGTGSGADNKRKPFASFVGHIQKADSFALFHFRVAYFFHLAGAPGFEPGKAVLETAVIPFHHAPNIIVLYSKRT